MNTPPDEETLKAELRPLLVTALGQFDTGTAAREAFFTLAATAIARVSGGGAVQSRRSSGFAGFSGTRRVCYLRVQEQEDMKSAGRRLAGCCAGRLVPEMVASPGGTDHSGELESAAISAGNALKIELRCVA